MYAGHSLSQPALRSNNRDGFRERKRDVCSGDKARRESGNTSRRLRSCTDTMQQLHNQKAHLSKCNGVHTHTHTHAVKHVVTDGQLTEDVIY